MKSIKKITTFSIAALSLFATGASGLVAGGVTSTTKVVAASDAQTESLQAKIAQLTQEVSDLNHKSHDKQTEIDATNQQIETAQAEIKTTKTNIAKAEQELAARKEVLKKQLVNLQKQSNNTISGNIYLDYLLNSDDITDLLGRTMAVGKISAANQATINDVNTAKAKLNDLVAQQEANKASVVANKEKLEADKKDLEAAQAKAQASQDALGQELLAHQAELEAAAKAEAEAAAKAAAETAASSSSAAAATTAASVATTTDSSTTTSSTTSDSQDVISSGNGASHGTIAGNSYPWGECTYYVKSVAPWAGNNWGNGGQWGSSAAAAGFQVDHSPAAGSIIVFLPGQSVGGQWTADPSYGHVGYVQSVSGNTVTITQGGMGFSSPTGPNTQTISNASSYIYIHQ